MRKLNNWLDGFMEYTQEVESPKKFLRWSAVSVVSAALERKTWVRFMGQSWVYPNMYIMLIGPAGLGKKSSGSNIAIKLLRQIDGVGMLSAQMTASSLIMQLKDLGETKSIEFEGHRFQHSAGYLYCSEAAVSLKEISGSVTELLTDLYDCVPDGWNKKVAWTKTTKSDGNIRIFNHCVGMLGCSTPDWLTKIIGPSEIKGGFASRILFVVQKGKPESSRGWVDIDNNKQSLLEEYLVNDLREINKMQGSFQIEQSFKDRYNSFKILNDNYLENNQDDSMTGYYSRKAWHIMKLAQVMSAAENSELKLTAKHWEASFEYLSEIEPEMIAAFGYAGNNKNYKSFHMMWDYITTHKKVRYSAVLYKFLREIDRKTIDEHLNSLEALGRITATERSGDTIYELRFPNS